MGEDQPQELSPQGLERREAMLGELLQEVDRTRAARRMRKRVSLVACALAVAFLAVHFTVRPALGPFEDEGLMVESVADDPNQAWPIEADVEPKPASRVTIRIDRSRHPERVVVVKTDPSIVKRYAFDAPARRIQRLDDRALLETLALIGRPSGLIYIDGHARLSRPVTD